MEREYDIFDEAFDGKSSQLNNQMKKIYNDKKAEINKNITGSRKAFKEEDYVKAKEYCNKIIKACDEMEKEISALDTTQLNGIGRINRKRYLNYATYMRDDAKCAIQEADEHIHNKK